MVYLWNVELNNRLGWVKKFASPASQAMAAAGIKSYNTYKKVFRDLVDWGFIEVIQEAKNQYSSNVIALSFIDKALDKALDKAMTTHLTSDVHSTVNGTVNGTCSIIKQINLETNKPINQETVEAVASFETEEVFESEVEEEEKDPPPKVARKGSPRFNALEVKLPHGDEFAKVWQEWVLHRKQKKSPLTELSVKRQLELVSCYSETIAIEMVLTSITSGYQGIFPLKQSSNGKTDKQSRNDSPTGTGVSSRLKGAWELLAESRQANAG